MSQNQLFYPLLTPIKFKRVALKPPGYLCLNHSEAESLLNSQLVGPGVGTPDARVLYTSPDASTSNTTTTTSEGQPGGGEPPPGAPAINAASGSVAPAEAPTAAPATDQHPAAASVVPVPAVADAAPAAAPPAGKAATKKPTPDKA